MNKVIHFQKAKFWYKDGILYCHLFNNNIHHSLHEESVLNYINTMILLCNGKKSPFVIDLRNCRGTYTTTAAKLLSNTKELKQVRFFEAFIINSISSKLLVDSYKRIYDPNTDYKVFDKMEDAVDFCKKMKYVINE